MCPVASFPIFFQFIIYSVLSMVWANISLTQCSMGLCKNHFHRALELGTDPGKLEGFLTLHLWQEKTLYISFPNETKPKFHKWLNFPNENLFDKIHLDQDNVIYKSIYVTLFSTAISGAGTLKAVADLGLVFIAV